MVKENHIAFGESKRVLFRFGCFYRSLL